MEECVCVCVCVCVCLESQEGALGVTSSLAGTNCHDPPRLLYLLPKPALDQAMVWLSLRVASGPGKYSSGLLCCSQRLVGETHSG